MDRYGHAQGAMQSKLKLFLMSDMSQLGVRRWECVSEGAPAICKRYPCGGIPRPSDLCGYVRNGFGLPRKPRRARKRSGTIDRAKRKHGRVSGGKREGQAKRPSFPNKLGLKNLATSPFPLGCAVRF
jgi:hypothetical protein